MKKLIGPFKQIVTMAGLNESGPIANDQLQIVENAGILIKDGRILECGEFSKLQSTRNEDTTIDFIDSDMVLLPGFIESHTHLCWAGNRSRDYALRTEGKPYLEIAKQGGGIMETVRSTRRASIHELIETLASRANRLLENGITTCEVKSGYGLTMDDELKMLKAIHQVHNNHKIDLIPTALPAHVIPPEYKDGDTYISFLCNEFLPEIIRHNLSERADIFIEEDAFSYRQGAKYTSKAKELGFEITIHADQFSTDGSKLAIEFEAVSADHLEASGDEQIKALAESRVVSTVLPGASLGLGLSFAPARKLLDAGVSLAISSDWNPGSAPMGNLLAQASLLGVYEKLTLAETLAGITARAAKALCIEDVGQLNSGFKADMVAFPTNDFKDIFWQQGMMKSAHVWKNGERVK